MNTFRAHVSAAPLKRPRSAESPDKFQDLPRSRERGPVEARQRWRDQALAASFRAHVSAAPLKHELGVWPGGHPQTLPRSRERGPVEAFQSRRAWSRRAVLPSALTERGPVEARRCRHRDGNAGPYNLPRSRERGPVEANRPCCKIIGLRHLPRSRERGPVEAL